MVKANSSFDPDTKLALEDCKELLDDAVQELQASFALVGESTLHTMDQRIAELQNWLSAVVTYQQTCQDQFGDRNSQYKTSMKDGMIDAGQLTSNALAIYTGMNRRLLVTQDISTIKSNVIVALNGSGDFKTITEALGSIPPKNVAPFIVYVKAGIYKDYVSVDKKMVNVFMYGDGPLKTVVTGSHRSKTGYKTMRSCTFEALGEGFTARSMAFENTAGPEGTTDFIFGDASCVIQNSLIVVNRPLNNQFNAVTAQGRAIRHQTTGLVLQNCKIVAEDKLFRDRTTILSYLGRPWKEFSRAVIMESEIIDAIHPDGWLPWNGNLYLDALEFIEYGNTGAGAATDKRVKWKGFID
ncbi:probable pectinesterase/pectinesterase inhibitor 13 [Hevea brasiliensis]|uniref:probable pectinesterase/pectinesterase inhibitor 13 n=1 Tax=Hevea brasiliensis TaxID=3981 RepID=UPI0025F04980|nr:probable pectinesterase/pectinesterase inhibitor 13 [Hevea brasiliensis]